MSITAVTFAGGTSSPMAKLLHSLGAEQPPEWVRRIDGRTLLIVDEAGMAGTGDLDRVVAFALGRGASVRLVGDARQLTARQSGGIVRDIAETAGAITLDTLVRFDNPVEAHASLGLRSGDPLALGYYLNHDRVHGGDHLSVVDRAYAAWADDRAAGRDSLLLAPTNAVDAIAPPTSVDLLLRVLTNEGGRPSATSQLRLDADPAARLRDAAARYIEAVGAVRQRIGNGQGPLPWLPPIPHAGPQWTRYLTARADLVADLAVQVVESSRLPDAPWAGPLLTRAPDLVRELVIWRVAHNVGQDDLRPCGAPGHDDADYQGTLLRRVAAVVDPTDTPTERWRALAESVDPWLADCAQWPRIARAFSQAADAGYDVEAR